MSIGPGIMWFRIRQIVRALWFLPAAFSLMAILTVTAAYYAARLVPDKLPFTIESGGVQSILTILGSSMLTVAVFSLSTVVGAVSRASEGTTPRAVSLIVEDRSSQTAISVFVGAFLFSIVGIIGLSSGIYSDAGRLILFFVTLLVVAVVLWALLQWIARISTIGRIGETIELVEQQAAKSLATLSDAPFLGCTRRRGAPEGGHSILAGRAGYVVHMDIGRLAEIVGKDDGRTLHILVRPGDFLGAESPLATLQGPLRDDDQAHIRSAIGIGNDRTFESDPAFGIDVLAEIATKALSPAINDTGTAIDVITAMVRVFSKAHFAPAGAGDGDDHPQLTLAPVLPGQMLIDGFRPIAREGAGKVELVRRLIAGLDLLADMPPHRDAAVEMIAEAKARAGLAMGFAADREAVQRMGRTQAHG